MGSAPGRHRTWSAPARSRRTETKAAPELCTKGNPLLHQPNLIAPKDFEGWIQERGLYFASDWDAHYETVLESHDPGEPEQKGGLLVAKYGKGTYIYCAYDFFRQLPAGVPGAVRLFVNLVAGR